jgi:hypothetical protein
MKKGFVSSSGWQLVVTLLSWFGVWSNAHVSMASSREDQAKLDRSLADASPKGRSGRQTKSGASWSEGLVAGEHVPDRVGESAGDVDLGDLRAALLA